MKTIIIAAALFAVLSAPALAEPLPPIMLGEWCLTQAAVGDGNFMDRKGVDDRCTTVLEISKTGFVDRGGVIECRFASLRRTGQMSAPHTKSYPHEMIPIMRGVANCDTEGERGRVRFELEYHKGLLAMTFVDRKGRRLRRARQ